jgi:hypothetical protein
VGGCDNNVFRTTQAGIYLRINNIRMLSISSDLLIARFAGLPQPGRFFIRQSDAMAVTTLVPGDHELKEDRRPFTMLRAVVIAQPIITLNPHLPEVTKMYLNIDVLKHSKEQLRSLKLGRHDIAWPLQIISNAEGPFGYFPNKKTRIVFRTARQNSDAAFRQSNPVL